MPQILSTEVFGSSIEGTKVKPFQTNYCNHWKTLPKKIVIIAFENIQKIYAHNTIKLGTWTPTYSYTL